MPGALAAGADSTAHVLREAGARTRCRNRTTPASVEPKLSGESEDGGEGQNRTDDTQIFSLVLYQLSYLATDVGQLKKDEYTMRVRR